jgi:LysM repeat protein
VEKLAKANNIADPNKIRAGQKLVIPDGFEKPAAHGAAVEQLQKALVKGGYMRPRGAVTRYAAACETSSSSSLS